MLCFVLRNLNRNGNELLLPLLIKEGKPIFVLSTWLNNEIIAANNMGKDEGVSFETKNPNICEFLFKYMDSFPNKKTYNCLRELV